MTQTFFLKNRLWYKVQGGIIKGMIWKPRIAYLVVNNAQILQATNVTFAISKSYLGLFIFQKRI